MFGTAYTFLTFLKTSQCNSNSNGGNKGLKKWPRYLESSIAESTYFIAGSIYLNGATNPHVVIFCEETGSGDSRAIQQGDA